MTQREALIQAKENSGWSSHLFPIKGRQKIIAWYRREGREFPWRYTRNPFRILISEMMLRRTQARQVTDVYNRFIARYPTVLELSRAKPADLSKLLKPLGLSWRNENFKRLARQITRKCGGTLAKKRDQLLSVEGIGPYVADSILCHAYGERRLPVDTNVVRVISRIVGSPYCDTTRRSSEFLKLANGTVPRTPALARVWHYAILDFAAMICRARNPFCERCPVNSFCSYCVNRANRSTIQE